MGPDDAVALLRDALDSSGIAYRIGRGAIRFEDISPLDSMAEST